MAASRTTLALLIIGLWTGGRPATAAPLPGDGGACCLSDGCLDTVDPVACAALGGFFLPGERCVDDPCAVGACCAGAACLETDAFTCLSGGRTFMGAGSRCAEDPCGIGSGACCVDGSCTIVDEPTCAAAGGTWLGPGTICASEPCVTGACCGDDTCFDGARFECGKAGGTFVPGGRCVDDPCVDPEGCPPGTLFGQPRDPPDDFVAGTSERSAGFQRWEDFTGVAGPIQSVTWWGLDLDNIGGNEFVECEETDTTFEISFHRDAGGEPGDAVCFSKLTATRAPLGISYRGAELNEYHATIDPPCTLVNGWISIWGLGDPQCWFLWMSAGPGRSWCDGCSPAEQSIDLSLCLQGSAGGVSGACCDDAAGLCRDDVDITDCVGPGQRFEPGVACAELDPPCGTVLGACCFADATCDGLTEKDCADAGGVWLGANVPCTRCPCLTPCPDGARGEGEPRCADGYVDEFNGGCFAQTVAFSSIDLGETVCGESGVYDRRGTDVPDVDVYEVSVPRRMVLRWRVEAEFQPRLLILDGNDGCPGQIRAAQSTVECEPLSIASVVDPGTYWLVVAPAAFTDTASCGARYTASVSPDPCPADLDGSGAVDFGDVLAVLTAWGPCPPETPCPEDLDGSGAVDFGDILAILARWGACPLS